MKARRTSSSACDESIGYKKNERVIGKKKDIGLGCIECVVNIVKYQILQIIKTFQQSYAVFLSSISKKQLLFQVPP